MKAKLFVGTLAAVIWCLAVVAKHFWADIDIAQITLACSNVLTGLGAYHLATGGGFEGAVITPAVQTSGPGVAQAGRASFSMLASLVAAALLLAGCSTAMTAYESAAYEQIKAANDNNLKVLKVAVCAQPLSAILRNPDFIPVAQAACVTPGADGGALLRGAGQPINITVQVPSAPAAAAASGAK